MKTKSQPQTAYGKFCAIREAAGITSGHLAAWAVHQTRQARPAVVDELKRKCHTVPVVMSMEEIEAIHAARPRVKRWARPINTMFRNAHHGTISEDCGKYSNRCTFKKIDHHPVAWSRCWITVNGRYMVYQYGPKQQVLKAPRGWKWAVDANGPHITNTAGTADYHPNSLDLNTGGCPSLCRGSP